MDQLTSMKKKFSQLTFGLLLLMMACSQPKDDAYIKEMDSLLTSLEKSSKDFEAIDYPAFETKKQKAKSNIRDLQILLKDTLKREDALTISNYARIAGKNKTGNPGPEENPLSDEAAAEKEKKAEEYGKHRQTYVKQELKLCAQQIEDLKHDYSKELMTAEDLKKHLPNEATNAKKIIDFIQLEKAAVASRVALFDSLNPAVEKILDSLKALPQKN
jgi:hypothetical protein